MVSPADCPRAVRVPILFEGILDPEEQREMADHLEHCAVCQAQFEQLAMDSAFLPDAARDRSRPSCEANEPLQQMMDDLGCRLAADMATFSGQSSRETSANDFPRPCSERPPEKIGPYEIVGTVGRGGMGIVWKARDPGLNRIVALKVLGPHLAADSPTRKRFLREARSAAAIRNDHVVTIHAVDDADRFPFLVMEYVPGCSLAEHLQRHGALGVEEILRIACQIARGIAAAHAVGIIHRDLKPANVLLEEGTERVKIADFGLARAVHDVTLTQSGCIGGTPSFMSPEQARDQVVDHRSDLFSFGSVLYAMCTGRAPFRGETALSVIRQVSDELPTPIRQINPECPQWLVDVVDRLMAKDPQARWQSASEVVELLESRMVPASAARLPTPTAQFADDAPGARSSAPAQAVRPSQPPRWPLPRLLALAAAALVVAFGILIVIQHRQGQPTIISAPGGSHVRIGSQGEVVVEPPGEAAARSELGVDASEDGQLGELLRILAHDDAVHGIDISPAGDRLISAAHDGTVRVWDAATGEMLHDLTGHRGAVLNVRFSPDGEFAFSAGQDQSIRMWDVGTGRLARQFTGHTATVRTLAVAAGGEHFYSGGDDAQVLHWHTGSSLPKGRLGYGSHQPRPPVKQLSDLQQLEGHLSWVRCLDLAPDQRQLASGGNEALLALWDAGKGEIKRRLIGHLAPVSSVAFTPDGKLILSASFDNTVRVWNAATAETIHVLDHPAPVPSIVAMPSSRHAVTACEDGLIRIFDLSSGERTSSFTAHAGSVNSILVTPSGDRLVSAGNDKTIRVWKMPDVIAR